MFTGLSAANIKWTETGNWCSHRSGDILAQDDLDFIVHQANCFHCMGAGVAGALAHKWKKVFETDCRTPYADRNKMGTYSIAEVEFDNGKTVKVVNLYSQFEPGCACSLQDLENTKNAIRSGLINLRNEICGLAANDFIKNRKFLVGFPWLIACGIYGMDEETVFTIIKDVFYDFSDIIEVVFVEL
jgi:O-acetyl-ADP-ribose deacetylase (regulator of RNase III)